MEKYFRIFFNILGLCSFKKEKGALRISKSIAVKNFIVIVVLLVAEISLKTLLNISIFLEEGQVLSDFTSFSIVMFKFISITPFLTSSFILFHHQFRQGKILQLLNHLKEFHQNFLLFAKCSGFHEKIRAFTLWTIIYMTVLKTVETCFMLKWNFWVNLTYFLRFFNDYVTAMFFLTYALAIKYASFLLENLNLRLSQSCQEDLELEKVSEFYESIWQILNSFHSIFHRQTSVFIFFIVVKIVLMVS